MRRDALIRVSLITLALVLAFATPAHANVFLPPMVIMTLPVMLVAFVPNVAIEAYVLWSWIGGSGGYALEVVSVANVVSTLIGIPFTWFVLLPLRALPGTSVPGHVWYMGHDDRTKGQKPNSWVTPAAGLLLLVGCFFASCAIEYAIAVWMLPGFERQDVNYGVLVGNLASYGIMAGFLLGWLIWEALSALRASLPVLRPVEEAQEALPALLEAEAVEREVPTREGDGQYHPIGTVSVVAQAGLEFQRVLTNADNGTQVKVPDTPNIVED
ncbi:hypothetical protein MYX64_07005 [Nitrospinae bacterium AH_259_B05_G02_I21]|nr:hypothetical protein [Nitrospinae bacterium AH_259_B05_G02_I21]MDA2932102.1 hypothetical protein [Nitrospinae bacterium AH-259-F20]